MTEYVGNLVDNRLIRVDVLMPQPRLADDVATKVVIENKCITPRSAEGAAVRRRALDRRYRRRWLCRNDRWIVHNRAVLGASIIGELEIIQLIASIELKMGRVGSIADREHAARAQLGRLQRVEIDVREINVIRAGERAVAAETGDGAGEARRMIELQGAGGALEGH